ncbi:hypothetical protein BX667DRAFT_507933 [Coemansia mojavensis]|nr:hypothetical protein BX667DRAFT_507933 [Coemansia mojavensis]
MPDNLPADIIYRIISMTACSIQEHFDQWRECVGLLAICRRWRVLAADILFSSAHINTPVVNNRTWHIVDIKDCIKAISRWSNIGLIIQNGSCDKVKWLTICAFESRHYISPLLLVIYLLALSDNGYVDADVLQEAAHAMQQRHKIHRDIKYDCYLAAANIGYVFAKQFPNVRRLIVCSLHANRTLLSFYVALMEKYASQLSYLEYATTNYFPIPWDTVQLKFLNICVIDDNIEGYPRINAQKLKRIVISTSYDGFDWSWFRWDLSAKIITFEALEVFQISSDFLEELPGDLEYPEDNKYGLELRFLKLKSLVDLNGLISLQTIKTALDCGLVSLYYRAPVKAILQVCKLKIQTLHYFTIQFANETFDEEFIEDTNQIFQLTYDVERILCALHSHKLYFNFSNVYWPGLKEIIFTCNEGIENIFDLAIRCPNLVICCLYMHRVSKDELRLLKTRIKSFPQIYPDPPLLVVKNFEIRVITDGLEEYLDDLAGPLKWLFPNLASFKVNELEFNK